LTLRLLRRLVAKTGCAENGNSSGLSIRYHPSSRRAKNIPLSIQPETMASSNYPASHEGRIAIVTDVEAGGDGRDGAARRTAPFADGQAVWSWRPDAGAKFAKTLSRLAGDGGNKARLTGESAE
jgi:hypothetical protein